MQRVPLDTLILQMVSMGLPDVRKFPFVEAPPPEAIENAVLVLRQHH
jgi:HrpA-like RNA helicase